MQRLFSAFRLVLMLLAAAPAPPAALAATPGEVPIGGHLRDAALRGLNGPPRQLSSFRGKPLIINVWASWCGPCREEMASLERLAWLKLPVHFRIIGISTDDHPAKARAYLGSANATISQFIDTRLTMENMLGASTIPLTVLVGADGRVLDKVYGARDWDGPAALKIIDKAFGARRASPNQPQGARSPPRSTASEDRVDHEGIGRAPSNRAPTTSILSFIIRVWSNICRPG